MKNFRNHTATAQAWYNQTHPAGQSSNLFFVGHTAYSYGGHYEIAKRVETPNGQILYFVNTNGYSNSTAKHTSHIVRQIDRENTIFVPFPRNRFNLQELPLIIERLKIDTANAYREQIKARTNTCKYLKGDRLRQYIATISNTLTLTRPYTEEEYRDIETLRQEALDKVEQIETQRQAAIAKRQAEIEAQN